MKIMDIIPTVFDEVKAIRYGRFQDERGFFTETYKKSDFENNPKVSFLKGFNMVQTNVSFSKSGVVRGLHFQWSPYLGKLVRVQNGYMIDLFLDIRKGSPTFGKIGAFELITRETDEFNDWIWIPVGFAHGSVYIKPTLIEYFCTAEYNPATEAGISPLADDIDWSLCDPKLKASFDEIVGSNSLLSEKDRKGYTLRDWLKSPDSNNFIYSS